MGAAQSRELKRSDKVRSKIPNTAVTCKPVTDDDLCFISRLRSWKGNVVEQLMLCPISPMHCSVDDPLLQLLYSFTLTDPFYPCFDVTCTMPAIERFPTLLVFHDYLKNMYKRNDESPESNINGVNCCSPDAHNIVRSWVLLRLADNVVEQVVGGNSNNHHSSNNGNSMNNSNNSNGPASSPFAPTSVGGHISTIKYGFLKALLTNPNAKTKISVGGYYHSLSTLTELPQGTFASSLGEEAACCGVGSPCADVADLQQQVDSPSGTSTAGCDEKKSEEAVPTATAPIAPLEVGAVSSGDQSAQQVNANQSNAVEVGLLQQQYRCDVDITFCLARTFCNEARSATLFHCVTYAERASAKTANKDQVVYPTKVNLRFRKGNLPALRLFAKLYQWHLTTPEGKPGAELGQNFNIASCDTCQSSNASDPSSKSEDELLCVVVNGSVLTNMLQSAANVCRKGANGAYTVASFIAQHTLPAKPTQQQAPSITSPTSASPAGSPSGSPGNPLSPADAAGGRESPLASGARTNSEQMTVTSNENDTPSPAGSNTGCVGLSSTPGLGKSGNLNSSGTTGSGITGAGKSALKQNQVVNMEASACPTPFDNLIKLAKISWSVEDANLGASQSIGGGGSSSMAGLTGLGSSRVQAQLGMIGPPLASPTIAEPYSAVNFLNVSGTNSPAHGSRHGSRQGSRHGSRQGSRVGSRQGSAQNSPMTANLQNMMSGSGSNSAAGTAYLGLPMSTGGGGRRASTPSHGYGSGNSQGDGYSILSPPPSGSDTHHNHHAGGGGSPLQAGGGGSANPSGPGTPMHGAQQGGHNNVPLMLPTDGVAVDGGGQQGQPDPYSPNVVPRVKSKDPSMSRGSSFQRGGGGGAGDSMAGSLNASSNPSHSAPQSPHGQQQQQGGTIPQQQQWNNQQQGGGYNGNNSNPNQQQLYQQPVVPPPQHPAGGSGSWNNSNNSGIKQQQQMGQPHHQQQQQYYNNALPNQQQPQQRGGGAPGYGNSAGNNMNVRHNQQQQQQQLQQQQMGHQQQQQQPFANHQGPNQYQQQQQQQPQQPPQQQNFPITIPDNTPVHASAGGGGQQGGSQWIPCWWVDQSQRFGGPRIYLQRCAYQPHLADGRVLLELHMDFRNNMQQPQQFSPQLPLVDANGQLISLGSGPGIVVAVPVGTSAYQGPMAALAPIM